MSGEGFKKSDAVKRCPRCKLVHSESDVVCRRCGVDLLTGEKMKVVSIKSKPTGELIVLRFKGIITFLKKRFSIISDSFGRVLKKFSLRRIKTRETEQIDALIYCMECGGEMKPVDIPYYPRRVFYPFLGISLILFGFSFVFPVLVITGGLSLASFFVYLRLRVMFWECKDCGSRIKRKSKKK